MKTRILVWAIIGLLVVATVIFLFVSPKRAVRVTLEELKRGATQSENRLNRLLTELTAAKTGPFAPANAELLSRAEAMLGEARQLIEKVKMASDIREASDNLAKANKLITKARRVLREASRPPKPGRI
ncbi:MAG: hypothetical protein ABIK44_01235 [candidate division WOR-3 bacterium]